LCRHALLVGLGRLHLSATHTKLEQGISTPIANRCDWSKSL